jgi:hypothetical protein
MSASDKQRAEVFVADYNVRDMFRLTAAPVADLEDQFAAVRAEGRAAGLEEAAGCLHGCGSVDEAKKRIRALKEKP